MTGLPAEKYFLNEVFQATLVKFFEVLQTKRGSFLQSPAHNNCQLCCVQLHGRKPVYFIY